jgi:hypothetical protein
MRWSEFFSKQVLFKDELFRDIHNRLIKLTPKGGTCGLFTRAKRGDITEEERAYLDAWQARQLRIEILRINYLNACFQNSPNFK